jgi:hypothetical protein
MDWDLLSEIPDGHLIAWPDFKNLWRWQHSCACCSLARGFQAADIHFSCSTDVRPQMYLPYLPYTVIRWPGRSQQEGAVDLAESTIWDKNCRVGYTWVTQGHSLETVTLHRTLLLQPLPCYSLSYFSRKTQSPGLKIWLVHVHSTDSCFE